MRYVEAGGARLSAIGLGTWQFGSREWGYGRDYDERTAGEIVQRALDLGVNLVDTAEIYGFGASERIVGRAIASRRDEVFVATKLFPALPVDPVVAQRARGSARRLALDRIDLYQLHWPNPLVPIGRTMAALRGIHEEGLVAHVGVSNFSADRWYEAERAYGSPVLSNQVNFSLACRRPERDVIDYARHRDRIVIAYSPLAQGLLAGRYDARNPPPGLARRTSPLFLPENLERATPLIETLRDIAAGHDATPSQVALAWVIRHPGVVAIPGASSVEQLEANVGAAALSLTDDEDAALRAASDDFRPATGGRAAQSWLRSTVGRR